MSLFGNRQCLNCGTPLTSQKQTIYCSRTCCRSMLMKRRWVRKNYVSHCHDAPLEVWTDEHGEIKQKCTHPECGKKCKRAKVYFPIIV